MKKSLKKRVKGWKIGDYVRQFSIVTGGVLLTLWLTTKITDAAKQREVKQAMQLVALELRDNVQIIEVYESDYKEEARIARLLLENDYSLAAMPVDSVFHYARKITSGLQRPYLFSTDALEMLKTSGLTAHVADKRQMLDLLRCYNRIGSFDSAIELYFDLRKEALLNYDKKHPDGTKIRTPEYVVRAFESTISDPHVRHWISTIPRSFDAMFFEFYRQPIEKTIDELEKRYGTSDGGDQSGSGQQQDHEDDETDHSQNGE